MGEDVAMDILLHNVSKAYGEKIIFHRYCLSLPEHKLSVIMGSSGKGKTTLLHLILGLQKPDSGEIKGNRVRKSAIFQEDRLCMNLSAVGNIRLVNPKLTKEAIEEEMKKIGLKNCFHQPVREFSGGMKRRVAILRALLCEAELLVLDEPFQGLDKDTKETVIEYMKEKIENKTVIMVTHDQKEAEAFGENIHLITI